MSVNRNTRKEETIITQEEVYNTLTGWCRIMMAAVGPTTATTRAYILDKYFSELEKYWEDEKNNSIRHRSAGQSVLTINCSTCPLCIISIIMSRNASERLFFPLNSLPPYFSNCLDSKTTNTCRGIT